MKIGLPTRELWIDGEWYSLCFNEKPIGPFMSLPNNSNHQIYQSNSTKFTGTFYCTVQSRFSDIIFSDYFHFSIYYIKSFDLVTLWDLVTVFAETKSVPKSRLHCTFLPIGLPSSTFHG